jgi:hypothetical protein
VHRGRWQRQPHGEHVIGFGVLGPVDILGLISVTDIG